MANASPEPFTNWLLSLGEDILVVGLGFVTLKYPVLALAVVVVLLGLMAFFVSAIIRAFKRRFRRPPASVANLSACALVALGLGASQVIWAQAGPPPQGGAPQAPSAQKEPEQRPVFRGGANFVRVDVFATKNGVPVEDLKAEDFEVAEDGDAQTVETFEFVKIQTGGDATTRVEPRTVRESRDMAADPRARVFVLFRHLPRRPGIGGQRPASAHQHAEPARGPWEDLIALMTPEMAASDITFTRRTDRIADLIDRAGFWGQRNELIKKDPIDQMYDQVLPAGARVRPVHVGHRRGDDPAPAGEGTGRPRGTGVLPGRAPGGAQGIRSSAKDGSLFDRTGPWRTAARRGGPASTWGPTDGLRRATRETTPASTRRDATRTGWRWPGSTTRAATSTSCGWRTGRMRALSIEPRGLVVFDTDIGPNPPPPVDVDFAMLRQRHETLKTAALDTVGIAVMDSNDINAGLQRVVSDLSSYYLLGYSSTNAKADGRYRTIRVRVKRPGVDVRARKGYQAPTAEEVAKRAALAAALPAADPEAAAVGKAVASLKASGRAPRSDSP